MLSIGFASRGSVANDMLLKGASFQFLSSLSNLNNSKIPPLEHTNLISDKLQENSSSAGISVSVSDSTSDTLKLIKSKNAQLRGDSLIHPSIGLADTTGKKAKDSVKIMTLLDSLKLRSIDSTARLENFRYQRHDQPQVQMNPKKHSKFFAYPSQSVLHRTVELDSTGNFVVIKEKIGEEPYKILLQVPLDEFIKIKMQAKNRSLWEDLAYKYELKDKIKDIGTLISDITNIDIPLPSVGFLSIFGKKGINIRINGAVDIHGAWRNETTEGVTASLLGNSRNEPDFKQQVQINVQGTIGDKLKIGADWNTERTFEYENQLKLSYTGYEDEIIQKIEAGNVSLQTSPLVGGSEALFGVKAQFQLGPLNLTTLASQKKGEVKEVAITGGSTTQEFQKRAYEYSTNHFFLDAEYASTDPNLNLFNKYYGSVQPQVNLEYNITDIQVWKSVTGLIQSGIERNAIARIDLKPRRKNDAPYSQDSTIVPGKVEVGRFVLLTRDQDYVLHPETGYISFKTQIQENDVIAVAYRHGNTITHSPLSEDDLYYGDFVGLDQKESNSSQKLVLKLVKPQNLQPGYKDAWKLQLRNIYAIGGRGINEEGFILDIQYQQPGKEPVSEYITDKKSVPLLTAFGLDLYGAGGTPGRDGVFDFRKNITINSETGEVIFPMLQPFANDLPTDLPDSLKYTAVYDTSASIARYQGAKDRFIIKGKYSASSSSVFNLGMVGIVENSVKVTLGGRELTPNVDYVVDYNIGQVQIRNKDALVPGADLKITYEQNDLFQLASKTLIGARGEFNFSKKTILGFSALNLNQQTLSDKVRIGEEPLNNSIYGVDFSTSLDLPFLTKGLDKLISTREMSSLAVKGEAAYINPDPNTKKSTISSDNNESIAYVDDFEGSKKTIPVGLSYTSWHDLSYPQYLPGMDALKPLQIMNYKGKSWWYNHIPADVQVTEIWPKKQVARNDNLVTVLDYQFDPSRPGFYNYNKTINTSPSNWGGIMKGLSSTANNLIDENIEFIEFWVQLDENTPLDAKIHIDLGKISEDVIPNGTLDTEDKNRNGLLDQGEDTGIDGVTNPGEQNYDPANDPDPAHDDFALDPYGGNYENINGTEGNSISIEAGKLPDTEDLNNNNTLDVLNSYFRYTVPLDTNRSKNKYIVGGGNTQGHWHLIRIPLKDVDTSVGNPSLSVVESIRLWVSNVTQKIHIRIADFNLVGSQWQKILPTAKPGVPASTTTDSTLELSIISLEENPEYYSPPGVERERDRSQTETTVLRNEQSLNLIVNDLTEGNERQIVKYIRAMDLFNYSEMKMFVHGDLNPVGNSLSNYQDPDHFAGEVYFRFGSDTLNYYEYRQPVKPDWNEVSIPFAEITALKQTKDTTGRSEKMVTGLPGHYFRVKGNPALTSVSFFLIGIRHPKGKGHPEPVSGSVWVDELRVIGADQHKGLAYSTSAAFKLADLMNVNFNLSQTDPYFHKLSDKFGSRMDSKMWGFNVDLDVIKLMPFNMPGSKLRINYSRTEQISKPKYQPGTDIEVSKAAEEVFNQTMEKGRSAIDAKGISDSLTNVAQSISTSETWSLSSIELRIPSDYWLIKETINNLRFSFSYNKSNGRNPTTAMMNSWIWNFGANYALTFGQNNFFYPADIPLFGTILNLFSDYRNAKVYFTPQNLNINIAATRNYSFSLSRQAGVSPNIARDFKATRSMAFNWKLTEGGLLNLGLGYNVDIQSSLAHLLTYGEINDIYGRREKEIWNMVFTKEFFGRDYQYQQAIDLRTTPRLPNIWDLNKYFTLTAGYNVAYSWQNNIQQKDAGRAAGFNNKINFGLRLKLKSLFEPLFKENKDEDLVPNPSGGGNRGGENRQGENRGGENRGGGRNTRNREGENENIAQQQPGNQNPNQAPAGRVDSLSRADSTSALAFAKDSISAKPKISPFKTAWKFAKNGIKFLLFDYETITFNFSQDNTVQKSGLRGTGTGMYNFWGLGQKWQNGPDRLFMLGLSQEVGPRAYIPDSSGTGLGQTKLQLSDNISQRNSIDFSTNKPLWEGAQLDIRWKVGWSFNKNSVIETDQSGNAFIRSITSTGSITRSFVSFPPFLFLTGSGIKKVNELDPNAENLSDAFAQGFESLPLLSKIPFLKQFAHYIPRPNWNLNWDGLEKFPIFQSFAKRVSLNHSYSADYSEGWRINTDGRQVTQSQKVNYGFQPLIGLTMTFNSLWNGNLTGNVKYSTKTSYDLGVTTKNITEASSSDIGITASYSKTGFDVPLFGVNLKNDIEVTFTYTRSKTAVVIYNMAEFTEAGTPQDGTVRTTMEPRIKYVISARVTASVFYNRTSVQPEGAARITPTTTSSVGLDVHVAIQ